MKNAAHQQADLFSRDWIASREIARAVNLRVLKEAGLSATLLTILNLLDPLKPVTAVTLASRMNVHPSTIVRSLDALEKDGLIVRRRNSDDRRETQITLSEGGQKIQERLRAGFTEHIRAVFNRMPAEVREALAVGFRAFTEVSSAILEVKQPKEKKHAKR